MEYILNRLERTYATECFQEEECRKLLDAAIQMIRINKMVRAEGILSLLSLLNDPDFAEEKDVYCKKYQLSLPDVNSFDSYLCFLLEEVTMGVDRADLEKMGLLIMSTSCFSGAEFVKYAIWLEGVMDIQAGVHPRMLRKVMATYLPVSIRKKYMEATENE